MTAFFKPAARRDPRTVSLSLEARARRLRGGEGRVVDFDAVLDEARRNHRCAECGVDLERWQWTSSFCSSKCRYRFRDRRRYAEDPEREREKSRAYYRANRERLLVKAAARRGGLKSPALVWCSECGGPLEERQRVVCSARCRDARYRRLHPEAYAEKERRKVERRRIKRGSGG